ncbi:Flp family type IVb pilin [Aurantiacibacter sp. MUD11]|uniref:Flp family type IVb pilin n=1 Tax=Aurantiacibacter sp. MUD11 TaxID=3003265 RepID=UPI0022AB245D|nr:Flp family type IVb pilin [Aurantiacibacter sp. MUD11]WAT18125.1 Flp family type IVb pilin [Aurantiacibacter sp. MUD11]
MTHTLHALRADERGATGIEYGFLASLVAVALAGAFETLGNEVDNTFGYVEGEYDSATR